MSIYLVIIFNSKKCYPIIHAHLQSHSYVTFADIRVDIPSLSTALFSRYKNSKQDFVHVTWSSQIRDRQCWYCYY
jgi:hypothetical protein